MNQDLTSFAYLIAAVCFILAHHAVPDLSLVAHSWGTMVSGHFAGRCPEMIDWLSERRRAELPQSLMQLGARQ